MLCCVLLSLRAPLTPTSSRHASSHGARKSKAHAIKICRPGVCNHAADGSRSRQERGVSSSNRGVATGQGAAGSQSGRCYHQEREVAVTIAHTFLIFIHLSLRRCFHPYRNHRSMHFTGVYQYGFKLTLSKRNPAHPLQLCGDVSLKPKIHSFKLENAVSVLINRVCDIRKCII